MTDKFRETWDEYTNSWKIKSSEEKLQAFKNSLVENCQYNDPLVKTKGYAQLLAYMQDFHKQIPGGYFVTNYFLVHSNKSISKWDMCDGNNNKIGEGISYGEYTTKGKLTSMTGFFETP